ncbi:MAG: hypothetical protein VYD87_13380 [Pseudomonadota bacterium]|nr:hypothetical protein [Pseudomonadota bacterium]MEE3101360.1 hypothetical protein [Pseudomonadota bacterium]
MFSLSLSTVQAASGARLVTAPRVQLSTLEVTRLADASRPRVSLDGGAPCVERI